MLSSLILAIQVLNLVGVWETSKKTRNFYSSYTNIVMLAACIFLISETVKMVKSKDMKFNNVFLYVSSAILIISKIFIFLKNKIQIKILITKLNNKLFIVNNADEQTMENKYDHILR